MSVTLKEIKSEGLPIIDELSEYNNRIRQVVRCAEGVKENGKPVIWDTGIFKDEHYNPAWCDICEHWSYFHGKCIYSDNENAEFCDDFELNYEEGWHGCSSTISNNG